MDAGRRGTIRRLAARAIVVATFVIPAGAGRPAAAADGPPPAPASGAVAPADVAAVKAAFDAAAAEMKDLVAELTVLQAQYHQPKADKAVVEARFNETAVKAKAASERLEAAAITLALADPGNVEARQISGAAVAGALRGDDAETALDKATKLAAAGVADADTLGVAATAALVLSRLDEAADWAAKAKAAGARKDRIKELEAAIDRARPKVEAEMARRKADAEADDLPRVKITTTVGDIVIELFENEAPNTVANFVSLVEKGFYAGTPFHRVINGFMAQGGDPKGTGEGGPGYTIACEVAAPGARQHFRGSLSMAHAGPDTGGSQFFLTFRPTEHLDGKHTVFGRVIEGFDVLAKLVRTTDDAGRPVAGIEPDKIVRAEVLRKRDHPYVPKTQPDAKSR
jgi:cyclophilin family peptidyl-prolyl cis-trans isomerase